MPQWPIDTTDIMVCLLHSVSEPAESHRGNSSCGRDITAGRVENLNENHRTPEEVGRTTDDVFIETSLLRERQLLSVSVQSREIETKSFQITIEKRTNKNQLAALDSE